MAGTRTPKAYRMQLAYEIARWYTTKDPVNALADADAIIAALPTITPSTTVTSHPLVHWIAERFEVHWPTADALYQLIGSPGQINTPDLIMVAGSSGARHGYRRGSYGIVNPSQLLDGNEIRDLYVNNNNNRLVFKVQGTYAQSEFTSLEIVGTGVTLLSANANVFDDSGGETFWRWNNTAITLTDGVSYAVNFT